MSKKIVFITLLFFYCLSNFLIANYEKEYVPDYEYDISVEEPTNPISFFEVFLQPGNKTSLYQIGVMTPLWSNSKDYVFFDLRGSHNDSAVPEVHTGIAYRRILEGTESFPFYLIFGLNSFYNRRVNKAHRTLQQFILGSEILITGGSLHFNYYKPFAQDPLPAGDDREKFIQGFDLELRCQILSNFIDWQNKELWFSAGYINLHRDNQENMTGPRASLEMITNNFSLFSTSCAFGMGVEYFNDTNRGHNFSLITRLKIPLGIVNQNNAVSPSFKTIVQNVRNNRHNLIYTDVP